MNEWKFLNQTQPQTLVNATLLCYIDAAFGVLSGLQGSTLVLLIAVALGLGGFGIANDKKWGYGLAVVGAFVQVALLVWIFGMHVLGFPVILNFLFDVVLVVLLMHPMSRDYQRIWFQ